MGITLPVEQYRVQKMHSNEILLNFLQISKMFYFLFCFNLQYQIDSNNHYFVAQCRSKTRQAEFRQCASIIDTAAMQYQEIKYSHSFLTIYMMEDNRTSNAASVDNGVFFRLEWVSLYLLWSNNHIVSIRLFRSTSHGFFCKVKWKIIYTPSTFHRWQLANK